MMVLKQPLAKTVRLARYIPIMRLYQRLEKINTPLQAAFLRLATGPVRPTKRRRPWVN